MFYFFFRFAFSEYELVQLTLNKKKTDKVAWNGLMKQLEKADRKVAMGCQVCRGGFYPSSYRVGLA